MLPPAIKRSISHLSPELQELFGLLVSHYESVQGNLLAQNGELVAQNQRLLSQNGQLRAKLSDLEDRLSKNSRNSSKPPSSDSPFVERPSAKSSRKKSKKKAGGQKGHKGSTLKMVSKPDYRVAHPLTACPACQTSLAEQPKLGYVARQVYDSPPMELKVWEHQAERKYCPCCQCQVAATFPEGVNSKVQYGLNLKALMTYFQNYQMLPYARTVEMIRDLTGHSLSAGTLYNTQAKVSEKLAGFEDKLIELLRAEDVAHFDETGIGVAKELVWIHLCTTNRHAHFAPGPQRGEEGMNAVGILPKFTGIGVHDFWSSYFSYNMSHAMCNAHLLRELTFLVDRYQQDWAEQLADHLRSIHRAVKKAKEAGKNQLRKSLLSRFQNRYERLVQQGLNLNPEPPPTGKKGRPKRSKARNLLLRLQEWEREILRFMYQFEVPFDNNLAERNLRMLKVKLKISGCFRSYKAAQFFMRIRSFILTATMQGFSAFQAIKMLFDQPDKIQRSLLQ